MASSYAYTSLPIRASLASSGPAGRNQPLPVSIKAITSYDQVLASWSKAIDLFNSELTKDEGKRIDLTRFPRAEFADFLATANDAKERVEQRQYRWTKNLQNLLSHINRYAVVGDVIVQHHAEYTSLVWGAFRFLLLFAVEEHNLSGELSKALETIIQIVFRAEEYAKLISTHPGSSTDRVFRSLHDNLTHLFAEILNFLIRATLFFEKSTLNRFVTAGISPFNTKFRKILKRVEDYECSVEKDKSLLELEAHKTQQEYDNGVWLKHADFETDLQNLQQVHISGTCQWFLKSRSFIEWRDSSSSASDFMWIQGKPGSGKSVLAAQIIQELHTSGDSIVIYVFCKNSEENKNTLESILRNLIFEMLEYSTQKKAFHRLLLNARLNEKSQYIQSIEVLWIILTQMITEMDIFHCVIDGLDECQSSSIERVLFLSRLVDVFKQRTPYAKLVVISQLHVFESGDHLHLWTDISIQPSSVRDDIELLALKRIEKSKVLNFHPEKDDLLEQLVTRSNGMILWTELMIKELEEGHWDVQNVLQKPPHGLFEMWRSILLRISHSRHSTERISLVLRFILAAARPLSHEELALGLAVAQGLCDHEHYDIRGNATAEGKLLVQESSPLLTSMPDDTVQLAHSSLKDYLFYRDASSLSKPFSFNEQDIHIQVSTVLIKYMSFRSFQASLAEQLRPKNFLLLYATKYLVYHSTRTGASTQTAERLVTFLDTVQGWRWIQRLSDRMGMTFGHLQLLQAAMASWAQSSCFDDKSIHTLSNFLLILAQNRHEAMKSLPNDDSLLLDSMENLATNFSILGRWDEAEELQVQVVETQMRKQGVEHPDSVIYMKNLAWIFDNRGRYEESKKLNMEILEISTRVLGADHPVTLSTMGDLALNLHGQGWYKESEKLNLQTIEKSARVLGTEHPNTLTITHNLAFNFFRQGRYRESEKLNIQVLESSTSVLGLEHPDTLLSMDNWALSVSEQGRYKESEKLHLQTLAIRTRVLGAEHPQTLVSMYLLAQTFGSQQRWKEAEELYVQILAIKTQVLGAEHRDTLASMQYLSMFFISQRRFDESNKLSKESLEMSTKVLGAEHPDTLISMNDLALSFDCQGRYKESEKIYNQIIETRTRVLGAEHTQTLTSKHNLASSFDHQGRYRESETLNTQILETRKKILGVEHPNTLSSMHNLATTLMSQKRSKEAEKLYVKILATETNVLGAENPQTLTSMRKLALSFDQQGRYQESEKLNMKILEARERVLGAEHPDTLLIMHTLATTYVDQNRLKKAEDLYVQLFEIEMKALGSQHSDTLSSMHNLASIYLCQKRQKEAEELLKQVLEMKTKVLGTEHPSTLLSTKILGQAFESQGQYKKSETLNRQVLETRTKVLGAEHPDTLSSMHLLATSFVTQNRFKEAEELYVRLVEMETKVLGAEHPSTLNSLRHLALTFHRQGQFHKE